jgi:hypothetical protein
MSAGPRLATNTEQEAAQQRNELAGKQAAAVT